MSHKKRKFAITNEARFYKWLSVRSSIGILANSELEAESIHV